MFREFLRFELRYQLRSPLPWLIALLFAFLAFLGDDGRRRADRRRHRQRQPQRAERDSQLSSGTFSILGMIGAILLIAQPLLRDADLRTDELFFSTPVRKGSYLWGRALGGALAMLGIYLVRRARHGDRARSCHGWTRSASVRS